MATKGETVLIKGNRVCLTVHKLNKQTNKSHFEASEALEHVAREAVLFPPPEVFKARLDKTLRSQF